MRILIINQPFWPDVVATAQHMADWTSELVSRGHEVSVIASRSVYGKQGAVLPPFDSYQGAKIYRVGSNLFRKGRMLTRLVDFGLFHVRALLRAMRLPRQDVVVCLTTPPFIGVVGMLLKILRGSRYVQYEMDLYPDVPVGLGVFKPRSLPTRFFLRIQRRLLHSADRVVVLGRCMQKVMLDKKVPAQKLFLVTPWADPEEIVPIAHERNPFRQAHGLDRKFVVMYAGNLGLGHDITTILGAIEDVKDDSQIFFVFLGGGRRMEELRRQIEQKSLKNVQLLDYVPREQIPSVLAAADLHLITQGPAMTGLIVPSKFYGILAAGRPSIYVGPADAEIAYSIVEERVGRVIAIGDVHGLVEAIKQYHNQLPGESADTSRRAREALLHNHSRKQCTEALTVMVESLISQPRQINAPSPSA